MRHRIALATCMMVLLVSWTRAQEKTADQPHGCRTEPVAAVPNRPTFSTTAETVQCGVFEVEYGMEVADGHQNINGLLKFGATKNLELRFGNLPLERDQGVAGFGDSGVGFKYRIVSQAPRRATIAAMYTATLPTATHQLGGGVTSHSVLALVSKDVTERNHLDFNSGVDFVGRNAGNGFDHNVFTSLSYTYAVTKKWAAEAEVAGFTRTNAATPASMTVLFAGAYSVSKRLVLDSGMYVAAFGHLPRATGFVGVTYSVADLYHRHGP